MASRRREVGVRITAQDDTSRGIRSATRRLERFGRVAGSAIGNLTSNAVTSAISTFNRTFRNTLDVFDRAQKLGQVLEIDPAIVRRFQLVGDVIGSTGESLTRLTRRLRDVAGGAFGERAQQDLQKLGVSLEAINQASADQALLIYAQALARVGNAAERSAASTAVVGARLSETALLLSENLPDAAREFSRPIEEGFQRAANDVADFNDALRITEQEAQNNLARAFSFLKQTVGATSDEVREFGRNLGRNAALFNPFTGVLGGIAKTLNDTREATKGLKEEVEETATTFGTLEPPTSTTLAIERLRQNLKKAAEEEAKAAEKTAEEEKEAAEAAKNRYDEIIRGLEAVVALEERQRRQRGGFGIRGETAERIGQPEAGPSRAQQALNFAVQQKQLRAIERLGVILQEERGNSAQFG